MDFALYSTGMFGFGAITGALLFFVVDRVSRRRADMPAATPRAIAAHQRSTRLALPPNRRRQVIPITSFTDHEDTRP
jgi:hypothetical protein